MPSRRCAMEGFMGLADVIRRLIGGCVARHSGEWYRDGRVHERVVTLCLRIAVYRRGQQ